MAKLPSANPVFHEVENAARPALSPFAMPLIVAFQACFTCGLLATITLPLAS